jgi:stage III sporulation protein SpoIIIAA
LINGLTCRIGRAVFGTISVVRDLLESEKSILILGKPGVGKTTIIREIARVLADEMEKRVVLLIRLMRLLVIVIFHTLELVGRDGCR